MNHLGNRYDWEVSGRTFLSAGVRPITDQPRNNAQFYNYRVYSPAEVMSEELLYNSLNNLMELLRLNNQRYEFGVFGYITFFVGDINNCVAYGPPLSYSARYRQFQVPVGSSQRRRSYFLQFEVHSMPSYDRTDLNNAMERLRSTLQNYTQEVSAELRIRVNNSNDEQMGDNVFMQYLLSVGAPDNASLLLAVAAHSAWRHRNMDQAGNSFLLSPFNSATSSDLLMPPTGYVNGTPQLISGDNRQVLAPYSSRWQYTRPNSVLMESLGML